MGAMNRTGRIVRPLNRTERLVCPLAGVLVLVLWGGGSSGAPGAKRAYEHAFERGRRSFEAGRFAAAIKAFDEAIRLRPADGQAYYQRGVCRERLSPPQLREAMADYRAALKRNRSLAEAHNNLAALLYQRAEQRRGKEAAAEYAAAERHLSSAVRLRPGYREAWYNLGLVRTGQHDDAGAVAAYRRTLALDPKDADALLNLAASLQRLGQRDRALRAIARAAHLKPRDPIIQGAYGELLAASGRLKQAIAQLRHVVALSPRAQRPRRRLAVLLAKAGKHHEAVTLLQQVTKQNPRSAGALIDLGRVYRRAGKTKQAINAYRAALALDPKQNRAWLLIGLAYAAERDCAKATRAFETYVRRESGLAPDALQKLRARCR